MDAHNPDLADEQFDLVSRPWCPAPEKRYALCDIESARRFVITRLRTIVVGVGRDRLRLTPGQALVCSCLGGVAHDSEPPYRLERTKARAAATPEVLQTSWTAVKGGWRRRVELQTKLVPSLHHPTDSDLR